jgi:hypothetical protein
MNKKTKNTKNEETAIIDGRFRKAMILITILLMSAFFGLVQMADSKESQQKPIEQQLNATKLWAVAFGADLDKNWKETVTAFKQDWSWNDGGRFTWRLKNEFEEIKQFQIDGWNEGKAQLETNQQQISDLFKKLGLKFTNSN